jgi:hypothetical protein
MNTRIFFGNLQEGIDQYDVKSGRQASGQFVLCSRKAYFHKPVNQIALMLEFTSF